MRQRFGVPFLHDAKVGARVTVHLDHEDGAMAGIYHFGTHGLTSDEIVAKRDAIVARHQEKTARFVAMDGLRSGTFKANEITWAVTEAIITEQGSDWRVYAAAATASGQHVEITRICATMAEVTTNEQLLLALKEEAEALAVAATSAADHAAMLELLLGMGGEG